MGEKDNSNFRRNWEPLEIIENWETLYGPWERKNPLIKHSLNFIGISFWYPVYYVNTYLDTTLVVLLDLCQVLGLKPVWNVETNRDMRAVENVIFK